MFYELDENRTPSQPDGSLPSDYEKLKSKKMSRYEFHKKHPMAEVHISKLGYRKPKEFVYYIPPTSTVLFERKYKAISINVNDSECVVISVDDKNNLMIPNEVILVFQAWLKYLFDKEE